ncbi:MAG: helix-hairpin-helix domain-containing protein [Christensenellaceae bacterium]|nr:helix-hairpin-helix domain-containing protein [Christensenellaceae bacterium]MEA5066073.1 helix-hairpin-helix domain-containing protein [Eubacteriales bacterium]MEA5067688.1 helix-hairpin-helix domain-containing protein [Christensenellaceae bacterium]
MKPRSGLVLAALIALMALAALGFTRRPPRMVYARSAHASGGVVRRDGRALIDLNAADEALLTALPGIGEALAGRITAYRAAHGRFNSPEDLLNIPGIGPGKLTAIRERVVAP